MNVIKRRAIKRTRGCCAARGTEATALVSMYFESL